MGCIVVLMSFVVVLLPLVVVGVRSACDLMCCVNLDVELSGYCCISGFYDVIGILMSTWSMVSCFRLRGTYI